MTNSLIRLAVVAALVLPAVAGAQNVKQVEVTNFPDPQNVVGSVEVTNLPAVPLAVNVFDEEIIAAFTTETRFVDVSGHSILRFLVTRRP